MNYLFISLRPKQWIKNIFILLPMVFGCKLFAYPVNVRSALAVIIFCMASSTAYLINDLIDIKGDREHPVKCNRPIASCQVSVRLAVFMAFIFSMLSVVFSFYLDSYFGYIVVIYIVFNFTYSWVLKDLKIVDVLCLAGFFILRLIAGSIVAGVVLSHWIVIMTMLLAMFLGFNKRRQELVMLGVKAGNHRQVLKKYSIHFIDQAVAVITVSIVFTYAFYTVDRRTVNEFGTKNLIYSIPFVYFGIFRYLYLIRKIRDDGDPTRIVLSDRLMQASIVLWIGACTAVIYL